MLIGGLQKFSLIDFPKKLAAVVFTIGCPFRCHFCHNPDLVLTQRHPKSLTTQEILEFLQKRKNQLEALVISGGEPTIQQDLKDFIIQVKNLGFLVKLDTSGINPDVLEDLIKSSLIDYIAMDIKAPIDKYPFIIQKDIDTLKIQRSIDLIMNSKIDYEFRTTLVTSLHTIEDPIEIAKMIKGARHYILQKFIPKITLNTNFNSHKSFNDEEMIDLQKQISKYVSNCSVR